MLEQARTRQPRRAKGQGGQGLPAQNGKPCSPTLGTKKQKGDLLEGKPEGMSEEEYLLLLEAEMLKERAKIEGYREGHRIQFLRPYWYQEKVTEYFRGGANAVIMPLSNKVGKTTVGACLVHSWAKGYEPWNPVPESYEGGVRRGDEFYMPSSLGRRPPVEIRITGEDWENHLKMTLIPELKKWMEPGEYETLKNNVGAEYYWTHRETGSKFILMTYKQEIDTFESFLGDGWWPDEPPPKPIWSAMSRALFMKGGKVFMSMTPLKEAWIWDELINSGRVDIKTVSGVTLWDCPHLYEHDLGVLMKCGLIKEHAEQILLVQKQEARLTKDLPETERLIKDRVGDKAVRFYNEFRQEIKQDAVTYALQSLKIHRFIKDLSEDNERIPRVFGEPKYLMGRVLKNFDADVNVVDDFPIPPDWPVEFQIDFHLNKPHLIVYTACDRYDRYFVFAETWQNMSSEELADDIVRKKKSLGLRLDYGEIDALSKGDTAYIKNRIGNAEDSFSVIEKRIRQHGIRLGVGSKNEKSYVTATDTRFKGVNGMPTIFIMRSCREVIRQIERWVYEDNDKPSSEGHAGECLGRQTQTGLKYTDPALYTAEMKMPEVGVV